MGYSLGTLWYIIISIVLAQYYYVWTCRNNHIFWSDFVRQQSLLRMSNFNGFGIRTLISSRITAPCRFMHAASHTHTHPHTHTCTHAHVHTHTCHTHGTHIHTHMHTYTHTHITYTKCIFMNPLIIAECISARLWIEDLFKVHVHTYVLMWWVMLRNVTWNVVTYHRYRP